MSDLQVIESTLARAARRRRRERAFRGMWRGFLIGATIWLVTLIAYKLQPIPFWTLGAAAGVALVSALVGAMVGGWHRATMNETARWVDGRQHLQERLSSALELAKGPGSENWRELLVTDAATHVKDLDPRRLVQFRLPKASQWALLVLALAAGLGFVPEYRSKIYLQKQADQKVIAETGQKLVELTKLSLKTRPPAMEKTEKAMEAVNDLGNELTKKQLTRTEALKDLANVKDRLQEDLKDMSKDPMMKRLQEAARSHGGENSPDAARLQKQIEETQKQMGTPTGTPEKMDEMSKQMKKLADAAKASAAKNGGMSQQEKENLSQSMEALAKQAQEMGMQMPDLDAAMQALASNQTDMFLKDMDASLNDLEKTKELAKSLKQMQAQMEKMGKDLGEQLQNGQPEMANSTLQKMIQQLKAANMTPDQMNKMMAEVSKAIDPGSKYGKVGDLLKKAAGQMQQGEKPGASQSLAEASKELEKLMQQMNDAQAMMAELDNLNKAQMCIGTCQGWGTCNKPGLGKGGKPGSGVGQWANEDGGWGYDGQQTAKWDNTGMTRPDTDPRGITDRGDGELNPALRPDKVKGQFSPGGQMPSITLKGISIKGTSNVKYEEATMAAQDAAQSALSQDKVPRAYQGAVREYFDVNK